MNKSILKSCVSLASLAIMGLSFPALAQDAAADAGSEEASGLDAIVVTAARGDKSQLNSSVSVTAVSAETIEAFKPSSEAEIFRMIPGIQVNGTSGPGGNANIAVRGLPVATGGAPFIQIQEDGLPTVLFGDIQFGNNDYWTRFDASVATVEGVRGGAAATFASQAPGAVINYISQTGKQEGGYIQLNKGVNFDSNKVDFRYGGSLNESTYFHVGGFYNVARGPLHADFNVSDSVQIKANLTKEFDGGKGYIRFLFKYANTQDPTYTGSPALATISGGKVSNVQPFPGFDGRKESNYSILNQTFTILNREGALERVKMSGIETNQKSVGGQFHYEFSDNITIDNNMRWSEMSGSFSAPFQGVGLASNVIGSSLTLNNAPYATVASIRYASGPNAGQVFTGRYVDGGVNVRTNMRDMGSFANDFSLTAKLETGMGMLTARAGVFYMNQKIATDWHVDRSLREVSGNNPAQLDLFDGAGNKLTQAGISGYNNAWGNRDYDLSYADTAPSIGLDLDNDNFQVDGSVRFDRVKASGWARGAGPEFFLNSDGVLIPASTTNGVEENLNYARSYTSYTVGALYKVSEDTSVFVRASRGGRFNADRQTLSGKIRADGALCTSSNVGTGPCTSDGVTPSVDFVKQYELGLKTRGTVAGGRYNLAVTLLMGNFKQSNFEPTTTAQCPTGNCIIDSKYKSYGAEFYGTYQNGGFSLIANATYTKAKRAGAGTDVYSRAPGLADLTYTASANYDFADIVSVGVNATGQTNAFDGGTLVYPGGTTFGGVIRVRPVQNLELGLQAYNLFNKFDFRGGGGVIDSTVTPQVIGGNAVLGRTFTASVRYSF
jgi:outer membrane receptor protein involved in Fe transport